MCLAMTDESSCRGLLLSAPDLVIASVMLVLDCLYLPFFDTFEVVSLQMCLFLMLC